MMSTCGKYVIPCVTRILVYKDVEDMSFIVYLIVITHYKIS